MAKKKKEGKKAKNKKDKKEKGILYSTGQLDCLNYYSKVFSKVKSFVKDREIATKTFIPKTDIGFILHRGSKDEPLTLKDISGNVTKKFLKKRVDKKLHDVEEDLNEKQKLIWRYFVPRKMVEMHYACNYEGSGKSFDRVFIDIDAGKNIDEEDYIQVVKELLKQIKKDNKLSDLCSFKIYLLWTGASLHVYLILDKKLASSDYKKYFAFGKDTLTSKWARAVSEKIGINVKAGHERKKDAIIFDTSATPSGKLARCPYSLHLNSKGKLTGVSVPINQKDLKKGLFKKLKNLTPDEALNY
ncbi:hypothetical protein GF378_02855 [Candidatus Pacearchaeota archaeon]|nr:hypothetical protein [Candidatus Pacearchaeota archaeon]